LPNFVLAVFTLAQANPAGKSLHDIRMLSSTNAAYAKFNVINDASVIPSSCEPLLNSFILQPPNDKCMWGISNTILSKDYECVDKILLASDYPRIKESEGKQHFCITGDNHFTETEY